MTTLDRALLAAVAARLAALSDVEIAERLAATDLILAERRKRLTRGLGWA